MLEPVCVCVVEGQKSSFFVLSHFVNQKEDTMIG